MSVTSPASSALPSPAQVGEDAQRPHILWVVGVCDDARGHAAERRRRGGGAERRGCRLDIFASNLPNTHRNALQMVPKRPKVCRRYEPGDPPPDFPTRIQYGSTGMFSHLAPGPWPLAAVKPVAAVLGACHGATEQTCTPDSVGANLLCSVILARARPACGAGKGVGVEIGEFSFITQWRRLTAWTHGCLPPGELHKAVAPEPGLFSRLKFAVC